MPELPEVETVRRKLEKNLKDKTIRNVNIIYKDIFEGQDINDIKNKIKDNKILSIKRRGKWLIFELDNYYLLSHLRMEGKFIYRNFKEQVTEHEHVIFNISDEFELRYKDTRKFGKMYLVDKKDIKNEKHLAKLGLEPWSDKLTTCYLKNKFVNKNLPIKKVLLDQEIIAGIGNIYADEILFLSKINPFKKASILNDEEINNIINNTKIVLENAIKKGGTTIRSYTSEEGVTGQFQNDLYVHGQEGKKCKICHNIIIKEVIGGRSTYYCNNCQKL